MSNEPIVGYRNNPCAECRKQVGAAGCMMCKDCMPSLPIPPKVAPYATNPARRLSRIKRWMGSGNRSPNAWMVFRHVPACNHKRRTRRLEIANALFHTELAWVVETAAKAIGGTDV